jgi:O-antigen/teichoic acid export membrane protein
MASQTVPLRAWSRDGLVRELRHSIIRRSAGVTGAFLIGHALSYALVFGANRILDPGGFGLFYASLMAITVLVSPMMAVMFVLGRRIASESAAGGRAQAAKITLGLLGLCMRWGLPAVALLGVVLAVAGPGLGIEAWQILLLIPATVFALGIAEVLRVSLQSMLLFSQASLLWLASQTAQVALSFTFLLFFRRVWTGILGVLLGAALISAIYAFLFARTARPTTAVLTVSGIKSLIREAPMVLAYSLFILISNVDILVSYWLLTRAELDVYAASALLPKAIITATSSVAQVLLPVVVEQRVDGLSPRFSVLKAIAMVAGMSVAAAFVLWIVMPLVQTTPFAIRGLDASVMTILAAGAVALSTMRVLVVAEVALQRYAVGLAQAGAVVLFIVLCTSGEARAYRIGELHTIIVWGFLIASIATFLMVRTGSSGLIRSQEQ